jgi:hypothetical protein
MNNRSLKRLNDNDLMEKFAAAAKALGEAINYWESGVKETDRLFAIRDEIRARGLAVRLRLAPLLDNEDRFVRYYAARQLLALVPERSRQIIEENAKQRDAIAGDAGMLLYTLDSGIYKPD